MKQRKTAQKIAFAAGMFSYLCALVTLVLAVYTGYTGGTDDPVFASLGASVVFFVGAGVVLHVIGVVDLPDLSIGKGDH